MQPALQSTSSGTARKDTDRPDASPGLCIVGRVVDGDGLVGLERPNRRSIASKMSGSGFERSTVAAGLAVDEVLMCARRS
jgi:hypothetical protein